MKLKNADDTGSRTWQIMTESFSSSMTVPGHPSLSSFQVVSLSVLSISLSIEFGAFVFLIFPLSLTI